jgi:hypothetical protein
MNCHLPTSILKQARNVASLNPEQIADLVETATQPTVIGIFPGGDGWAHLLRGDSDAGKPLVLAFASSITSFQTKQLLRQRERAREEEARRAELGKRTKTAVDHERVTP